MLNIFWIHSHITFLISREIIISRLGKGENIIIFLSRGYQLPILFEKNNIQIVICPWYRENSRKGHNILVKSNILETRKNVKECKGILDSYINDKPFILFAPTSWEYTVALLIKHRYCKGYYYIEEGTLSYMEDGNVMRRNFLIKQISKYIYNLPYLGMLGQLSNFIGTYAISEEAFPWNKKREKHLISFVHEKQYYTEYLNIKKIIIFDHLNMLDEDLIKFINKLCNFLKNNNILEFAYKFHPVTKSQQNKETIIRNALNKFSVTELPSDFIIELFLINRQISMYSINSLSSLSIYAKKFGSKSFLIKQNLTEENVISLISC